MSPAAKRADAARNREAILDAAQEVLSRRPHAGLAEVATASGLTRTTVYAHFANREELVGALVRRAVEATTAALDPDLLVTGPADEALRHLVCAGWRQISSFGRLMSSDGPDYWDRDPDWHTPIVERVTALVRRGRADGTFRTDVPESWLVTTYFALVHAAGQQMGAGAMAAEEAEGALLVTLLDALDRKSTRLNSSHRIASRMPSSA